MRGSQALGECKMVAVNFKFVAEARNQSGKAHARRLRQLEEKVPGVVYGGGKATESIMLTHKDLMKGISQEAVFSHILTLQIGNEEQKVVIKALQRHPWKPRVLHIDFLRINANEKLTMRIPIHFLGEDDCPGVKAGGVVSHLRTEVELRCLPANLPESIEVDVSHLELDQSLHLSDLKLPEGVEFAVPVLDEEHNVGIISVSIPKVSQEDLAADAAETAAAENASADSGEEGGAETSDKE